MVTGLLTTVGWDEKEKGGVVTFQMDSGETNLANVEFLPDGARKVATDLLSAAHFLDSVKKGTSAAIYEESDSDDWKDVTVGELAKWIKENDVSLIVSRNGGAGLIGNTRLRSVDSEKLFCVLAENIRYRKENQSTKN